MKLLNNIPTFVLTILLSIAVRVSYSNTPARNKAQKNILIFIADDLAWNEIGCYGGTNVKTPNIDKLAKEGILFNNMYSSTSMCCPTRASIYTGLYPMHHGVVRNHEPSKENIKSVAHYLGEMGYRVGLTGKEHFSPRNVYPFEIIEGFEPNCVASTADYNTEGIEEFIKRDNNQPFCLFVCSTNPHVPWTVGDASKINPEKLNLPPVLFDNKKTRSAFSRYLAEIEVLDQQFGDVISVLEENGNYDNTVITFCGEQGPQLPGGKWTCWDYGQKSAFIIKLPEMKNQEKKTNALVQYEDLLPTMINYIGGTIPENIDGKSFLSVLENKSETHRKWVFGIHNNVPEGNPYPVRTIRNEKYKLILNLSPELVYYEKHLMGLDKENYWLSWVSDAKTDAAASSLVIRYLIRPEIEFYNLVDDPWELHNLAEPPNEIPEIAANMKTLLLDWMKEQGDPGRTIDVESSKQ